MTANWELFAKDPRTWDIPNEGGKPRHIPDHTLLSNTLWRGRERPVRVIHMKNDEIDVIVRIRSRWNCQSHEDKS